MNIQELLALNAEGLIPGPGESEDAFVERVRATKEHYSSRPASVPAHHWQWATEQLTFLFDFSPRWITTQRSKKGLAPWQAAMTHIDVKRVYSIQVRPVGWTTRWVDQDEILAHEAAHAARAAFDEPAGEELFAYLSSEAKWRRVIGPLFRSPGEAALLLGLIGTGSFCQILELFWDGMLASSLCFCSTALLVIVWSWRLARMRMRCNRAARFLSPFLQNPNKTMAVLFRLTDEEIRYLARGETIEQSDELRWQLLRAAYWKRDEKREDLVSS